MGAQQHQKAVQRWFLVGGDQNLRLAYPLNENSVVFDLGGYHGDWAVQIATLYNCKCHVFEPVPGYAEMIRQRCAGDHRFAVHEFALGRGNGSFQVSMDADGTSGLKTSDDMETVQQKDIAEFIRDHGITRIDLMKINIEGAEYELLNYLIGSGLISIIDNVQIQFHHFVEDAERKRAALQGMLGLTHDLIYDFPFVWESWSVR